MIPHPNPENITPQYGIGRANNDDDRVQMLSMSSRPSFIGRVRTCANVSAKEWLLVFLSTILIGLEFGFTMYRLAILNGDSNDIVFSILVLANLCFSTFYLFHGIFQEQPFEILMLVLTTMLVWLLVMSNFLTVSVVTDHLKLVRFLVSSCLTLPCVLVGCMVAWRYWTSARLVFKTVGADMKLQTMCKQLYFAYSLLTFDAQAMLACVILILRKGVDGITTEQIFIIITGAIFTCIWLGIGYFAMRLENMNITWLFGVCSIVQPVYVLFLFVQAIEILLGPSCLLTVCIFISSGTLLITHFSLLAMIPIVSFSYGKGLKEKIYGVGETTNPDLRHVPSSVVGINRSRKGDDESPASTVYSRGSAHTPSSSSLSQTQPLLGSNNRQPPSYESIVQVHDTFND